MGAFYTNLQVAVGASGLDTIRAVLAADAGREGMVAVAAGETADRTVIVVPGERWTAIYDEASESQDHAVLDRLGKALSKATGAASFSVLIHDSDVLRLALYQAGKRTDAYDSNPGYFSGRSKKAKPDKHVAAWAHLAPSSEAELRTVFGGGELFAEAVLPLLAQLVGVGPERLDRGQKYLTDGSFGPLPAGAVVVGFRSPARPAWAQPASGPPRLETQWEQAERLYGHPRPAAAIQRQQAAVGGRVQVSVTTMNAGGAGTGLVVEVAGGDLVTWQVVQAVLGNPRTATWIERPLERDGDRWVARFPEAPLPPGQSDATVPATPAAMMKAMEARFATQVHVNVIGSGARAGRAEVTVRLTPDQGTGTSERGVVEVRTTEGRPLRAPADLHPTMLAPLRDRSRLVALVVLEPAALPRVSEILAAVAPALPTEGKVRTVKFPGPPKGAVGALSGLVGALTGASAPKLSTGAAGGFLGGKRWRDLLAAAIDEGAQVQADWVAGAESMQTAADLHVGSGILAPPDAVPVATVGLVGGRAVEPALVEAIDRLATDGVVLQAFVTRWGQTPGPDVTPYELACGVHGQCTTQRAWATRWLRGLGPGHLWLGRELAARVPGVGGVPLGEARRVAVGDLATAEAALAELLPSGSDWQAGVMRRHGR